MKFCLLDTNVLIDILHSKDECRRLISTILAMSYQIIIPKKVEEEFVNNHRKNKKDIEKFKSKYQINTCDISNSKRELSEINIDYGEADAFLQIQKKSKELYHFQTKLEFLFITRDNAAIEYFQSNHLPAKRPEDILNY